MSDTAPNQLKIPFADPIDDSEHNVELLGMKQVTKEVFYNHIGGLDACGEIVGSWPYTTVMRLRYGPEVGRIVMYYPRGKRLTRSRYYLKDDDQAGQSKGA